jgi:hypothetical protein
MLSRTEMLSIMPNHFLALYLHLRLPQMPGTNTVLIGQRGAKRRNNNASKKF